MHGNERVELEHRDVRVRRESGQSLGEARIRELADGVHMAMDNFFEAGAEALRIHVAGKPVFLQTYAKTRVSKSN